MNKKLLHFTINLLLISLISLNTYAQNSQNKESLTTEMESLIFTNPKQSLKIAQHLLSKSNTTNSEKAKINLTIAKTYFVNGDYSASLTFLFDQKEYISYLSELDQIEIEIYKAKIFRKINLFDEVNLVLKNVEDKIKNINEDDAKLNATTLYNIEKISYDFNSPAAKKGIQFLKSNNGLLHPEVKLWKKVAMGNYYLETKNLDLASQYYNSVLESIKKEEVQNLNAKVNILIGLANINFQNKAYQKTKRLLNEAMNDATFIQNQYLKYRIVRQQLINYQALNDQSSYKETYKSFKDIDGELSGMEENTLNVAYNLLSEEYNVIEEAKKESYYKFLYTCFIIFGLTFMGCFFYWRKYQQRKINLTEVLKYLELTRTNTIENKIVKIEVHKRINIPKETEELILSKLKKFEKTTKFTNNDISLAVLAGQFETNTKYLSEIINSHYNVNFNTYINKLRINYLVEKLKSDSNFMNYKISYLAEVSGFTSHSSFATIFKSITGISPVTFIELLKEENAKKIA